MACPIIFVTFADFYGSLSLTVATGNSSKGDSVLGGPCRTVHLRLAHTHTYIYTSHRPFSLNDRWSHLINNEPTPTCDKIELQSSA